MGAERRRAAARLIVISAIAWTAAAGMYGILRSTFGRRPAAIHVRWAGSVDDSTRQRLEQQYRLADGETIEGRTWSYALLDLSRDNIRALVGDPGVEDTHEIHRTAFRVGYFSPRLPYRTPYPSVPAGLEILTVLSILAGLVGTGLVLLERVAPTAIRGPLLVLRNMFVDTRPTLSRGARALVAWVGCRVPAASAEAVALFRIVFGIALLMIVMPRPVALTEKVSNVISAPQQFLLTVLAGVPRLDAWIQPWILFWGALFIVAAFARLSYFMLTLGVFAWALLYTARTSYHTVSALLVALICLSWSQWGDAWSVDAWRRRGQPVQRAPQEYGYTLWIPGVVLGVAYAAAAFSKVSDGGLAWILNGTVKYHFLADSRQAMVDWGLQLGRYPRVAVLLSFVVIAVETLILLAALQRRYVYRFIGGLAALSLLTGFMLFQGLFWPGWWILLLSFLPWHLVAPTPAPAPSWRQGWQPGAVVVLAVIAMQILVSALHVEVSPLLSTYDMYSTTYSSPEEFERKSGDTYWIVATDNDQELHECRITRTEADMFAGIGIASNRQAAAAIFGRCFDPSIKVQTITIEITRGQVDWEHWRLEPPRHISVTGPIPADVIH
jgi:hypothetical protein